MTVEYFGTENVGGKVGRTLAQRLSRAYELAGYAVALGTAPEDAILVHGTIHGIRAPKRIGHAWLVLSDGDRIWEPASASFLPMAAWKAIARPEAHKSYRATHVRALIAQHGTWGPWHDLGGNRQLPGTIDINATGT